jgi:hypothetical protein
MLGLESKYVALAYVLCIASTLLCLIYGLVNWNRGDDRIEEEDIRWAVEEKEVEKEF